MFFSRGSSHDEPLLSFVTNSDKAWTVLAVSPQAMLPIDSCNLDLGHGAMGTCKAGLKSSKPEGR